MEIGGTVRKERRSERVKLSVRWALWLLVTVEPSGNPSDIPEGNGHFHVPGVVFHWAKVRPLQIPLETTPFPLLSISSMCHFFLEREKKCRKVKDIRGQTISAKPRWVGKKAMKNKTKAFANHATRPEIKMDTFSFSAANYQFMLSSFMTITHSPGRNRVQCCKLAPNRQSHFPQDSSQCHANLLLTTDYSVAQL